MVKNSACLVYARSDIEFVSVPTMSNPGQHEAHFFRYSSVNAWRGTKNIYTCTTLVF